MLLSAMAKYDSLTLALYPSYVHTETVTQKRKKMVHLKGEREFLPCGTEVVKKLSHWWS